MPTKDILLIRKNWHAVPRTITTQGDLSCYNSLLKAVGEAKIVLLGEASHGTHEFYKHRAEITKRLIEEKGFNCISIEADFPDCDEVNQYVRNVSNKNADEALNGFQRFPTWMWRNTPTKEFLEWLCTHNRKFEAEDKVGFYGLDLYSSDKSMEAVLDYLNTVDQDAASRAKKHYECMKNYVENRRSSFSVPRSCQEQVLQVLRELQQRTQDYLKRNSQNVTEKEKLFYAVQNALVVKNAEHYYRAMFCDGSWNIRDSHFFETLQEIRKFYLNTYQKEAKVVIWAHNSHVGDSTQTEMKNVKGRDLTIGRLCREHFRERAFIIGFSTYHGSVTAADNWDGDPDYKKVNPGMKGSIEHLLYQATLDEDVENFILLFRSNNEGVKIDNELVDELANRREQRAIGVIYRPKTEKLSHYFEASVSKQFDSIIHFNRTKAVHPLHSLQEWAKKELEETFPFGV